VALDLAPTAPTGRFNPGTSGASRRGGYPIRDTAMAIEGQLWTRHSVGSSKGAVGDASRPIRALTSEGNSTLHPSSKNY